MTKWSLKTGGLLIQASSGCNEYLLSDVCQVVTCSPPFGSLHYMPLTITITMSNFQLIRTVYKGGKRITGHIAHCAFTSYASLGGG